MKLLTASTSFETARQQNADNNGHRRMTIERRRRTDVGEARTPRKFMSKPATRNTEGSAGGSANSAQSLRLASGGTSCGGSGTTTAGTVLPVAWGTCAHSAPYCVVTSTHWKFTQSSPKRDFGWPTQTGDGDLRIFKHSKSISATFEWRIQMLCGFGKCTEDIYCKIDILHGNGI